MKTNTLNPARLGAAAATLASPLAHTAEATAVNDLVARISSTDDKVRGPAWQGAGPAGAPAVKPLAALMTNADYEIARSAKRAIYKIIRHAGRPGAEAEAKAVTAELIPLLKHEAPAVRREALWMLSEIGGDDAIAPMAALLSDAEVRDDARCTLTRLPGPKSLAALKSAFASASEEFKFALADSLRARGETVDSHPTKKLVPTRATTVGQPGAK